ncbi:MAG: type II CRISPR-associated endonuclease Cas1 [Clostridia bacterium]
MSWRTVVVTGIAKLDFKMDYLVLRKKEETYKIHLSEIGMLLIESTAVSLTAMLLCELAKHKIKVVFCDEQHNPHSELLPYYGSHDTSAKIRKQIAWTDVEKELVWTEIVTEKIRQQSIHLQEASAYEEAELLEKYITEVEPGDASNREGHAAKVYFNALFGLEFTRSEDNAINAALNYGYGILLSCFNKEIVANGYMTQIGLFHDNMFNPFNLASDYMEPFRPVIDRIVAGMKIECFDTEEKREILSFLNDEVFIDGKCHYVSNAIKIYCRSVFDALNERDVSLIRFYRK